MESDVFEPLSSIEIHRPSATRSEWYNKNDGQSAVFEIERQVEREEEEGGEEL